MKAMINTLKNYIHEQKYMHICSGVRFGGILVAKEFVIKAMNSWAAEFKVFITEADSRKATVQLIE